MVQKVLYFEAKQKSVLLVNNAQDPPSCMNRVLAEYLHGRLHIGLFEAPLDFP